jgi:hypothetical protein
MNDRELLEAAAMAAGLRIDHRGSPLWNPLTDDGDAFRLAVKLNLHVEIDAESSGVITIEWDFDESGTARRSVEQDAPIGGNDYAATRRAIVRAAALKGDPRE